MSLFMHKGRSTHHSQAIINCMSQGCKHSLLSLFTVSLASLTCAERSHFVKLCPLFLAEKYVALLPFRTFSISILLFLMSYTKRPPLSAEICFAVIMFAQDVMCSCELTSSDVGVRRSCSCLQLFLYVYAIVTPTTLQGVVSVSALWTTSKTKRPVVQHQLAWHTLDERSREFLSNIFFSPLLQLYHKQFESLLFLL